MEQNTVINALKEAGLWRDENIYFLGKVIKPAWKVAAEWVNSYVAMLSKDAYAIINKVESGIAIMPIKVDTTGWTPLPEISCLLRNEEIDTVEIKKAFMAKKVIIKPYDSGPSSFLVEPRNGKLLQHEENFKKFTSLY